MADEIQGELFGTPTPEVPDPSRPLSEQQQQTEGDDDGLSPRAKARFEELSRRNKELESLVNMNKRIDDVMTTTQQSQQILRQQQEAVLRQNQESQIDPSEKQWDQWMAPKAMRVIGPELQRRDAVIMSLADQIDVLRTMQQFPDYARDPELQAQVENIQKERMNATGYRFSRTDILTYIRGMNVDKYAEEKAKKMFEKQEEEVKSQRQPRVFIEGAGPVSSRPLVNQQNKPFQDWSTDEMEKFFKEHPELL